MDDRQRRIVEDLAGTLDGELRCDALTLAMYATDGSLYQVRPIAVACPANRDDVVTLAKYSLETRIPLIPRGAGTGIAGGAIGPGIVVDFARNMHRVEAIGEDWVQVQPGVVLDNLNAQLRPHGRYFSPDPSNAEVTTIGGMLAVDAAGSHAIRVGSTRDHVGSIELVLPGGGWFDAGEEVAELGANGVDHSGNGSHASANGNGDAQHDALKQSIVNRVAALVRENDELIQSRQPSLVRNCAGYYLRAILANNHLNLARLLVGSEGTLGLFTGAILHTAPLPTCRGVVLFLFGQLEAAVRTVQTIVREQPSACDLLDRRLLSLAREQDPRFESLLSTAAEAALIVEQTGHTQREVRARLRRVVDAVRNVNLRAVVAREAVEEDEVEFLWSLPQMVVPHLARLRGQARPLPFIEDLAVPPQGLHEFLIRAQKVFQKHHVTASLYSHAAAGQVHLRPFLPPPGSQDGPRFEAIARDIYQVVFSVGGTVSGEHGDGLSRTAFLRSQYGPLYKVFEQIKEAFDPHNLMNPGKIINDDPHVTTRNFRSITPPAERTVDLQLRWTPQQLNSEAVGCNGCGHCRTQAAPLRMCPFFRIAPSEAATPRAKANLLRDYVGGTLDSRDFTSENMKSVANLCFNCKQCQLECPSNVNVPQMMIEAKASYVASQGLRRADWILSRAHSFGAIGCTISLGSNWALSNPSARWILEKISGIARKRKLPAFARRSFLRSAGRDLLRVPKPNSEHPTAVYFVSEYANYHDPQLARALVSVLKFNGVRVHVPPGQTGSGMAMVSAGDLDAARDVAETNVRVLAELAREGYPIICTEPAAALCLSVEYPMLLDHPDVELVASKVVEAGAYLWGLHEQGKLRTDFAPLNYDVGYHTPCHLKALGRGAPLVQLMSLIPELRVHTIEEGCSGMAGAFGLTVENYETSLRIGWNLIQRMRKRDLDFGTTECTSCKIQMEQGTSTPTVHPLKLLALAYGLMPEIRDKLKPVKGKLVVS